MATVVVVDLRIPGLRGVGVNSQMSMADLCKGWRKPQGKLPHQGAGTGPRAWEGHLPSRVAPPWPWLAFLWLHGIPLHISLCWISGVQEPWRPSPALATLPLWLSLPQSWNPSLADTGGAVLKQSAHSPLWSLPCSSALRKPLK